MFGLPWSTTLLVFGFPLIWILYTVGFLIVTRDWGREESESGGVGAARHKEESSTRAERERSESRSESRGGGAPRHKERSR